jgi:hypothetical protein
MFFLTFLFEPLLGTSTSVAEPTNQKMQKEQLEDLLKAALPFAEMMLKKHGEFYPYGATMGVDGKITNVGGYRPGCILAQLRLTREIYLATGAGSTGIGAGVFLRPNFSTISLKKV